MCHVSPSGMNPWQLINDLAGGQGWLRGRHGVCYESVPGASVIDSVHPPCNADGIVLGVFALDIPKTTNKELYGVELVLRVGIPRTK